MTISEFLLRLATDAGLRERYRDAPDLVFDELGITGPKRDLLLAANLQQLKITIEAEANVDDEAFRFVFVTIWWIREPRDSE